jgi:hypothetical protein
MAQAHEGSGACESAAGVREERGGGDRSLCESATRGFAPGPQTTLTLCFVVFGHQIEGLSI